MRTKETVIQNRNFVKLISRGPEGTTTSTIELAETSQDEMQSVVGQAIANATGAPVNWKTNSRARNTGEGE